MTNPDLILAVVELAQSKAPLIRATLLTMPHLEWAHSSIASTDEAEWTRGTLLALVCTGRAVVLSKATRDEQDLLIESIDAVLDSQVGTPSNEFPSLELEEFDAGFRDDVARLRRAVPDLGFEDRFNSALGKRVCTWAGHVPDPKWEGTRQPLLHMTIGRACAMTVYDGISQFRP